MIALVTILISAPGGVQAPPDPSVAANSEARRSSPPRTGGRCTSALNGLRWYSHWRTVWRKQKGAALGRVWRERRVARLGEPGSLSCPRIRRLAEVARWQAYVARYRYKQWLEKRLTLHAFDHWRQAVQETQRAYPGTASWLMSCSASEGGWGRWVPNSQGAPPGGWLQFYESTFWRMWEAAHADIKARGYHVPRSAHSWYSPLGQALAGAWGLTHGRRGEWAGAGC
jgi:hypothetical protein